MQYGVECFCSNTLREYPMKEDECNKPCPGNKKQMCGGTWRISVYKTSKQSYFIYYIKNIIRIEVHNCSYLALSYLASEKYNLWIHDTVG